MEDFERLKLKRFLLHLHWVLNHPAARGQTVMSWVHGLPYTGPVLDRSAIHRMAGLPEDLPTPAYPEEEYCVERRAVPGTALSWEQPVKENIVFPSGTVGECQAWMAWNDTTERMLGVNRTGRKLITDEEAERRWYEQFGAAL